MFEISNEGKNEFQEGAKIKVVGIGGGGCNAVNTMIKSGLSGVEYIVANTDAQALSASLAPTKVQLGVEITKGLGAGANPEVGRKAALDEYEKISEVLEGADMVFITAGMGGGTGTGAAPIVAKLCKELGALTVGVVTKPFIFEGKKRFRQAEEGILNLEESVDSLITIPNQRLLHVAGESLSLVDTFKKADEVLLNAVRGISDLINNTGHINADFADVSTVMGNKGLALMGTGIASGPDRAIKAATDAISSPLLEDITIDGATGIIINITGNSSLTMHETNEAVTLIMEAADDEAEIIFGTVIDEEMEEDIKVTVIATGLCGEEAAVIASPRVAKTISREREAVREPVRETQVEMQREVQREVQREMPREESFGYETLPHEVEEEVTFAREEEVEASPLVDSIKRAAHDFHQQENQRAPMEPMREEPVVNEQETQHNVVAKKRARSIAEKLGFINFNEEELDTPSFLRKDEAASNNKPQERAPERQRPLDL